MILRRSFKPGITLVSNIFIDNYMAEAPGDFVKVYLCLLRVMDDMQADGSIADIADKLDMSERVVKRALTYWEKRSVLGVERKGSEVISVEIKELVLQLEEDEDGDEGEIENKNKEPIIKEPIIYEETRSNTEAVHPDKGQNRSRTETNLPEKEKPGSEKEKPDSEKEKSGSEIEKSGSEKGKPQSGENDKPERNAQSDLQSAAWSDAQSDRQSIMQSAAWSDAQSNLQSAAWSDVHPASQPEAQPDMQADMEDLDLAEILSSNEEQNDEHRMMLYAAEKYLGRTLTVRDLELFNDLHSQYGFPYDLIEYLVEYCVDVTSPSAPSARYIETVAMEWHKEGKLTLHEAKEDNKAFRKENRAVMKAFGITGRILGENERKFVDRWIKKDHFTLDVVVEACDNTMTAIKGPSFEYADKILARWKEAGVKTVEDARKETEKYRQEARQEAERKHGREKKPGTSGAKQPVNGGAPNRFHNFEQRKLDYEALLEGELGMRKRKPAKTTEGSAASAEGDVADGSDKSAS